ncbi:MAG: dual specificity protein phosphatase family protein [Polyangiales bacterium]
MTPTVRDRDTLRWTLVLVAVDAAVWALAALYSTLSRALGVFVSWGAFSLLVTTALYLHAALGGRPGDVLKGARWPWLQPVLFPFRAVSWCTWRLARAARRGDGPDEVCPGVWVGPRPLPAEIEALAAQGVTAVLDLTAELPTLAAMDRAPWTRLALPTLDRTTPPDARLDEAARWIVARRAAGEGVYIHCAFGRGRSGVLACVALLALGLTGDPDDALARVTAKRRWIRLREGQRAALRRFAARRAG